MHTTQLAPNQSPPLSNPPALDPRDASDALRHLANAIQGEVRLSLHDRLLYSTDASLYQVEPLAAVIPANVDDAERAARVCFERKLPLLPRGGGTSLAGQCTNRAVVLDLSPNCRAIRDVNISERTCAVEPGVYVEELNNELTRTSTGLFFAPDPATVRQAAIGGCIGNNAAGARSILYGRTSENLLGLDALLPTGERLTLDHGAATRDPRVRKLTQQVLDVILPIAPLIKERFPKTVRRNAGYNLDLILQQCEGAGAYTGGSGIENTNLSHLICGAEGTLALTLGATLKLHPTPKAKGLAVLSFATLDEAIDAVLPILETRPSAVELLDDLVVSLARANPEASVHAKLLPLLPSGAPVNAVLYVEYFADDAETLDHRFVALKKAVPDAAHAYYVDPAAMLRAWRLRQSGEPLLHGLPGERKPITFIEDNAIPPERLSEFVKTLRAIVEAHGTRAAFYAHASVGVLHVRPLLSTKDPDDLRKVREIATQAAELARSLGGVMSGEHGDGRVRTPFLESFYGPEIMRAFRAIKHIFDPHNLLNPGNIVEPRPIETITARLRVDTAPHDAAPNPVRVPDVRTFYEYADQHGFDHAVEMCNGAGVCRKRSGGTMCPSYQVLQDERHATRGRANALRLAITGQLGHERPAWNDPDTLDTLDLCLSCKACKSECPSNVDVARLKSEYVAQSYEVGRPPSLAARAIAHVRFLNRLASHTPKLANALSNNPLARPLINRLMDVSSRRSLPPFGPSLEKWHSARPRKTAAFTHSPDEPRTKTVALFADCFCAFGESNVGRAAIELLEAFGYRVLIPKSGCCARPAISTGQLRTAIAQADQTISALDRFSRANPGCAFLFLEPSCLSAVKDDWQDLRLAAPKSLRRDIADRAFLIEDFIEKHWDDHPKRPAFKAPQSPVLLHAHCHQKALWGAESSAAILRRIAGPNLQTLDTGCCGMAGAFGFPEHRFDLSMAVGERTLFPKLREAPEQAHIAIPGTSCRHQTLDAVGLHAKHPVELLRDWLTPTDT